MTTFEQIHWVVAEKWESHAEACIRKSLTPLEITGSIPWPWNFTVLSHVVSNKLNQKILPSINNTGISGCCAPSLWCNEEGCFTQGYSRFYSNYGWLSPGNGLANIASPVYTCYNYFQPPVLELFNASVSNGFFSAKGHFSPYPNASLASPSPLTVNIFGTDCSDVEVTYCRTCNKQHTCPFGSTCLVSATSSGSKSCYVNCDSPADLSCPRGFFCRSYSQPATGPYNCFPNTSLDVNSWCSDRDYLHNNDLLTCQVNSAQLQLQHPLPLMLAAAVLNVSLLLEEGASLVDQIPVRASAQRCKLDRDCFDGNLCTRDSCVASTGYCRNELVSANASCDSISSSVRERVAPYTYRVHYVLNASATHGQFRAFMLLRGKKSAVASSGNWPFQKEMLNFNITFFGNSIRELYVGPNGLILLPPLPPNPSWRYESYLDQLSFFSSASNAIAPWYADWNPAADKSTQVLVFHQSRGDASGLFGVDANAVHVFYSNFYRAAAVDNSSHSFAASIYSDNSVRLSYLSYGNGVQFSDYSGLWGAFVSQNLPSFSRYHYDTVSKPLVAANNDAIFCFFQSIACMENTCIRSGTTLKVRWSGTDRCDALAGAEVQQSPVRIVCAWAGGLAVTPATLVSGSSGSTKYLQCPVPSLALPDGSITFVDIVIGLNQDVLASKGLYVQEDGENLSGAKSVFGVFVGSYSELSRSNLMVEYFSNRSSAYPSGSCGCNPISRTVQIGQCDSQNVCTGNANAFYVDCFGTAFGSAYLDPCGNCAMGYTGRYPSNSCPTIQVIVSGPPQGNGFMSLLSQTIILLIIICCLTFITSTVSYTIRRLLYNREMEEQLQFGENDLAALALELNDWNANSNNNGGGRGLSEFERDALGQVAFTSALHKAMMSKMDGSKLPADPAPPPPDAEVSEEDSSASCSAVELGQGSPSSFTCECSICLMELQEGTICRSLPEPCGHIFHLECIDEWFRQSLVCPLCKRSIRAILEGVEERNNDSHSSSSVNANNRAAAAAVAESAARNWSRSFSVQSTFLSVPASQQSMFLSGSLPPPRIVVPSTRTANRNNIFGHAVAPASMRAIDVTNPHPAAAQPLASGVERAFTWNAGEVPTGGSLFPPPSRAGFERALTSEEQAQSAEEGAGDHDDEEGGGAGGGTGTAMDVSGTNLIPDHDNDEAE